jgi:MoaA/NifB/PqqE/SkfB family radical SAM enzyme
MEVAVPAGFRTALERLRAAQPAYELAVKAPVEAGEAPETLIDRVRAELALDCGLDDADTWHAFVEWAARDADAPRLLHVLSAVVAESEGDALRALRGAETAVAMDHRDSFAHRLYGRARARHEGERAAAIEDLGLFFCAKPFEEFEVRANGDVYTCCSAWLPVPIGNLKRGGPDEIWNSPTAQAIRRSILDGSFRYCSRGNCPLIIDRRLKRRDALSEPSHREIVRDGRTRLEQRPLRVLMSQDRSCNLSCPSCRQDVILAGKAEQDRLNALAERTLFPLLRDARQVKITGSGDPFASAHFRHVLKRLAELRLPQLRVQIQTNGVLLDERAWGELGLEGLVESVWVSIDAATPATYAVVRRGGDFARLLSNLVFLAWLRESGRLPLLRLDFVVQALNFREMPAAAELARALGADGIYFQMIRNWGTYSVAEFREHYIGSPDHPAYFEFLAVLRHPSLDWPGVDFSNVRRLRDLALATQPATAAA